MRDCDCVSAGRYRSSEVNVLCFRSCGYYHTALIDGVGRLLLFGNNDDGQLGRSKAERSIGSFHISMPESVIAVACGNQHTIVLTGTGRVYVCGKV